MPEGVVAREREFGAVAAFLAEVRDGPAALVFAGEPGIGKTTVWQEAVAWAQASSMTVLVARPVEA
jgi:Cdc6-like AAA superfamily ATPase